MKKFLALLLALSMVFALCACGMSEEEVYDLVDRFADNGEYDRQALEKASATSSFERACVDRLAKYEEASDLSGACSFVTKLKNYRFRITPDIRDRFQQCVGAQQEQIFQNGEIARVICYYNELRVRLSDRGGRTLGPNDTDTLLGLDFLKCFPYDKMTDALRKYGVSVICTAGSGGYYDTHTGVEEEDYWESPLTYDREDHAVAGYQHVTKKNLYAGDLDVVITQKVFSGTSPSDKGNSVHAKLYYNGKEICDDYISIENFLKHCTTGNTFFVEDEAGNCILFAIEEDQIVTLQAVSDGYLVYR
ncbi:MAG: hypothetical protein IK095_00975 [Oscillospiraceae bacterium]|nr:hypothetical protein [Oscillospiraceae bacterium]